MTSFFRTGSAPDQIYRNTRDGIEDHHKRGREYLEHLWRQCAPYVDPDAAEKATRDLPSVYWELQLAYALTSVGKKLALRGRLGYRNNKGPDLFTDDGLGTWIEAAVVRCGSGPDALQQPEPMKVYSYDPDGVVLRLRSVLSDKSGKIQKYVAEGIIKPGQATVIAISGVALPHRFSGISPPEILRAVYPADHCVLKINPATMAVTGSYVEYRDRVTKRRGAQVATDVFLNRGFSHISAVLFGEADWVDPATPPGADFKLVHNSRAEAALGEQMASRK